MVTTSPAAPAASAGAGSIKIEAGAAGKVFKIEKKVGDAVKKGDAVLVLEIMKMETPVVAPEDGTVASIDVAVGDAVEPPASDSLFQSDLGKLCYDFSGIYFPVSCD